MPESAFTGFDQFLGWPIVSFVLGLFGFFILCIPSVICGRNVYGGNTLFSIPFLLFPKGLRNFAARGLGAVFLCQALFVGLVTHQRALEKVQAAEKVETFCPAKISSDWQEKGLYLHRLTMEMRKTDPHIMIGMEEPFTLLVRTRPNENPFEFDLLQSEFRHRGPEDIAVVILQGMKTGAAPRQVTAGQGYFPPAEDADVLIDEARAAWERQDYRKSLKYAERAHEIRRSYMGDHHPLVQEVEVMIAAAQRQANEAN